MPLLNTKLIIGSGMILTGAAAGCTTTSAPDIATTTKTDTKKPPNVLVIMADDLGFSDIAPYGGEIDTPNLNRLAEQGVRFSDFQVTPYSAPSRAAFLTGSDPHKVGLGNLSEIATDEQQESPLYLDHLNDRALTIAQRMQQAGYFTVMSGKWHLGTEADAAPYRWGFDETFTMLKGQANHFKRENYPEGPDGADLYRRNGKLTEIPDDFYSSKNYANYLIDTLNKRPADKPFFAYIQFTAPHAPLQAPDADIAKYDGRYNAGPRTLAKERFESAKRLNLIPESARQPELIGVPAWDSYTELQRQKEIKRMQIYAGMIDNMDRHIGKILSNLAAKGELDNTYVFFFSDNGSDGKYWKDLPEWGDWVTGAHDNSLANMGNYDSYVSLGTGWAQASNMPFSLFKGFTTEGGVHSPLIISGPGVAKNKISGKYTNVTDIVPTILDMTGVTKATPTGKAPIDGTTLIPALKNPNPTWQGPSEPVVLEMNGGKTVRYGDYKLLAITSRPSGLDSNLIEAQQWQLFNLKQDPGETTDLSSRYPRIRDRMIGFYNDYAQDVDVIEVSPTSK